MSELTTTRIRAAAERLGLTHLPEQVTTMAARAEADQLGYLDFLDLVLGEEVALREQRRFRNALKLSGLPHHKTLEEFDYTFQPDLEPRGVAAGVHKQRLPCFGIVRPVVWLGP